MATIISRLFEDTASAKSAVERLAMKWLPRRDMHIISAGQDAAATEAELAKLNVDPAAAPAYAARLASGEEALLVVRATYKPLQAAVIAREVLAETNALSLDGHDEEIWIPDGPESSLSILTEHPRFLTMPPDSSDEHSGGPVFEGAGFKSLSTPKRRTSAISGGRHMSRAFWPMPLLSSKRRSSSVYSGGRQMSKMFWPMKLISSKRRSNSVIRGGGTPFSRLFGWSTVS